MPPKAVAKDRAWGTRYDSLGPCMPSSPGPLISSPKSMFQSSTPSILPASITFNSPENTSFLAQLPTSKSERLPHHASIFVGSLPSHMEHAELTHLLSSHLSGYASMKSVKVVRDTKGGVCAFIQCESPESAAHLFQLFRTQPPPPFLGRSLRFEPARAFRTLLISFRAPSQAPRPKDVSEETQLKSEDLASQDLPSAMRVVKTRNPKHISLLYNDDARNFVYGSPRSQADEKHVRPVDPFQGEGLYFPTLQYDKELVRALVEAFGTIESFNQLGSPEEGNNGNTESERIYPPKVMCPPGMDAHTWEVKWEHRDDCVAALAVLRRMSFIAVVWAHHLSSPAQTHPPESQFGTPTSSPGFTPFHTPTRGRDYVLSGNSHLNYRAASSLDQPTNGCDSNGDPRTSVPVSARGDGPSLTGDGWPFVHSTPPIKAPSSSPVSRVSTLFANLPSADGGSTNLRWSDNDFPPLRGTQDPVVSDILTKGQQPHTPTKHANRIEPAIEVQNDYSKSPTSLSSEKLVSSSPLVAPKFPPSLVDSTVEPFGTQPTVEERLEVVMLPTPEFSMPSTTHITPSASPSDAPQSTLGAPQTIHVADLLRSPGYVTTPKRGGRFGAVGEDESAEEHHSDVDPTTIFIGGLDMFSENSWDETKLRSVFEKYGEIENVQMVKPLGKKSAFAFVRYCSAAAGVRAVSTEHNRIYDGRQIRVQLRDNNPQRSPWRLNRGRGRMHNFPPPRHHYDHAPPGRHSQIRGYGTGESSVQDFQHRMHYDQESPAATSYQSAPRGGFTKYAGVHPGAQPLASDSQVHHQYGGLRAQSVSTSLSVSPPPSAGSSQPPMSAPGPHHPGIGYFAHQPWLHPYAGYPYAIPVVPSYMGFPPSGTNTMPHQGGGTPPTAVQNGISALNGQKPVAHPIEQPLYPPHTITQPPLRPTGFIQGEHGTLIPVYQPEALDQYMSHTRRDEGSPQNPPQGQMPHGWQPYPPVPIYPYFYHPPSMHHAPPQQSILPPNPYPHTGGTPWGHSPIPVFPPQTHHTPPPYLLPPAISSSSIGSASSRQFPSTNGPTPSHHHFGYGDVPSPRRAHRRDSQPNQTGLGQNSGWSLSRPQRRNSDLDGRTPVSQTAGFFPRTNGPSGQY